MPYIIPKFIIKTLFYLFLSFAFLMEFFLTFLKFIPSSFHSAYVNSFVFCLSSSTFLSSWKNALIQPVMVKWKSSLDFAIVVLLFQHVLSKYLQCFLNKNVWRHKLVLLILFLIPSMTFGKDSLLEIIFPFTLILGSLILGIMVNHICGSLHIERI